MLLRGSCAAGEGRPLSGLEKRRKFYCIYTVWAVVLFACICLIFVTAGKSLVWNSDALKQHYISLAYYGNYLRSIIKSILVEHTFRIPLWDLHIGYGSDIITTLNYYVLGDPVNLLSVFVPERFTEYLYGFLIFLRMYLAGIAFSRYCFFHKCNESPVLLGCMIYISSQYVLVTGFTHPFFLGPCLYLPLLLLGADKIFAGKRPFVYIFTVAAAGMSNFYFFYMLGIFAVVYAVFRYFIIYKKWIWKEIGGLLGKFFLYSMAGISIASVILLPVIMRVLDTERLGASYYVPALYKPSLYRLLPTALIGSRLSKSTVIGVAGICFLALVILFMRRRKYQEFKAGTILMVVMLCLPFAGHVMNGFTYISNRWSWAAVMFFSYLFVKMYPEFFLLSKRKRLVLCAVSVLYGAYVIGMSGGEKLGNTIAGGVVIVLGIVFLLVYGKGKKGRRILDIIIIASVCVSIFANLCGNFLLHDGQWERTERYIDIGTLYETTHKQVYQALAAQPGVAAFRYEQNTPSTLFNTAMLNGLNGGQYYFSVAPYGVSEFFEENYISNSLEQIIHGLNNRAWLMKLFSMRYFVGRDGKVPYGFAPVETAAAEADGTRLYEDKSPLPLVYTYDKYIPREAFEKMSGAQKQEAMLQGVVLERSSLPECEPQFTSREVPFKLIESDGVQLKSKGFRVRKRNASCILELKGDTFCETYLCLNNFQYKAKDRNESSLFETSAATKGEVSAEVVGYGAGSLQTIALRTPQNHFMSERRNYMFHMGYHAKPVKQVKLTFTNRGQYSFDSLTAVCQKMDTLNQWSALRNQDTIENFAAEGNHVTCSLTLKEPRALVFSIPYNKGWSLMVDGEKAELKKANGMFMAAELEAGEHDVLLHYRTPYFLAGAAVSFLGILIALGIWIRLGKTRAAQALEITLAPKNG